MPGTIFEGKFYQAEIYIVYRLCYCLLSEQYSSGNIHLKLKLLLQITSQLRKNPLRLSSSVNIQILHNVAN